MRHSLLSREAEEEVSSSESTTRFDLFCRQKPVSPPSVTVRTLGSAAAAAHSLAAEAKGRPVSTQTVRNIVNADVRGSEKMILCVCEKGGA